MWMLHEKRDKSINVWKKADFEWITEPWPRLQAENSLIPPELMDEVAEPLAMMQKRANSGSPSLPQPSAILEGIEDAARRI